MRVGACAVSACLRVCVCGAPLCVCGGEGLCLSLRVVGSVCLYLGVCVSVWECHARLTGSRSRSRGAEGPWEHPKWQQHGCRSLEGSPPAQSHS